LLVVVIVGSLITIYCTPPNNNKNWIFDCKFQNVSIGRLFSLIILVLADKNGLLEKSYKSRQSIKQEHNLSTIYTFSIKLSKVIAK
jgi:hypothetical protein